MKTLEVSNSAVEAQGVPTASVAQEPRKKLRAVLMGGGIGMFPPLMERFREDFELVAIPEVRIPTWYALWYRLVSIRWPRNTWYRKWRYYIEKTPSAFRIQTREFERQLKAIEGQYDVILFFGAMFSPGPANKPIFIFTDSCRWLSSRNAYDEVSHFHSAQDESEWLALEGQVYQSASRIFVGSDFVRDALIAHYGVAPTNVVTTGFGAGTAFGEPYQKEFDGKSILYIGKGDFEKKGGTLLMQAFEKVRKAIPDAKLHVVGQDRLSVAEGVINHGFVRDKERLIALMRSAHVFALPSLVDRNPISILEAMAAATPCIASDYGAMPGMVGDAGIITPCNDVDALAEALLKILRDQDFARAMGERGRKRYETIYNWDSVWQITRREIREALRD